MEDLDALRRRLMEGENGEALRSLASSPEAKRLGARMDAAALEKAARSGDAAQLRSAVEGLLSTPEGKALAEKLSRLGNGHG